MYIEENWPLWYEHVRKIKNEWIGRITGWSRIGKQKEQKKDEVDEFVEEGKNGGMKKNVDQHCKAHWLL